MAANQPYITLGDGQVMPQFGFGVWKITDEEVAPLVKCAIDAGCRAVDTAALYFNEAGVGKALRDARGDIFVTTKLGNYDHGYDEALRAFDKSSALLGPEQIDLYLIHWPCPIPGRYVESWRALVALQKEGRVRSIGVSNFTIEHLKRIIDDSGVVPAVNQVELHPRFQQVPLRTFHQDMGIATEAWSPLGKGLLLADERLESIARKHDKTTAQVVLRWHIERGTIVIPKSVTPARIRSNIEIFDFSLDESDHAAIALLDDPEGRIGPHPDVVDGNPNN